MQLRFALLVLSPLCLSGCSYAYDVVAEMRAGSLLFVVAPTSPRNPECLRDISVESEDRIPVRAVAGDDLVRTGYGTTWRQAVAHDDRCANRFPIEYGRFFAGKVMPDTGQVSAKPLQTGVVYRIGTVSGATGYGSGRFKIAEDGSVENLPLN